jgi:hypothetical protein
MQDSATSHLAAGGRGRGARSAVRMRDKIALVAFGSRREVGDRVGDLCPRPNPFRKNAFGTERAYCFSLATRLASAPPPEPTVTFRDSCIIVFGSDGRHCIRR